MIKLDIDVRCRVAEYRYREPRLRREADPPRSVFDDNMVVHVRTAGPRLPITSVAGLARQLRRALIAAADQPVAEIISGHVASGAPSQTDHLAIVPLPAVRDRHADGTLLGIALVLPRSATGEARAAVMRAIARLEGHRREITLLLAETGELVLGTQVRGEMPAGLVPRTWTRPSARWASVTPVALDRNPGDLGAADPGVRAAALKAARRSIVAGIRRIGLPAPVEVDVVRSCVVAGTAGPGAYPRFANGAGTLARVLVHVQLRFAACVRGPVLLGAGRYRGLGLCLPMDRTSVTAAMTAGAALPGLDP